MCIDLGHVLETISMPVSPQDSFINFNKYL